MAERMTKEVYDFECEKWKKFLDEWELYKEECKNIREYYKNNNALVHCMLIDFISYTKYHKAYYYLYCSPTTEIYSKEDLLDPNFILPGKNMPFTKYVSSGKYHSKLLSNFGKYLRFPKTGEIEKVIGYKYSINREFILTDKGNSISLFSDYYCEKE